MADVVTHHITRTPDVCGGKACLAGRRIRVMDIVNYHEILGWSPDEITSQLQGITLSDVYAALAYYHDHRDEIISDMQRNAEVAERFMNSATSNKRGS